jgi:hypothetical protein
MLKFSVEFVKYFYGYRTVSVDPWSPGLVGGRVKTGFRAFFSLALLLGLSQAIICIR